MSELYSNIIRDPLTCVRQGIADDFFERKLDDARLKKVADDLAAIDATKAPMIHREYEKAAKALSTGNSPETPDLTDPMAATLWGATLATLSVKTGGVSSLPVWKQAIAHPVVQRELQESAYELYRSFRKIGFKDFKVTLNPPPDGYPALAYYCDPVGKAVNLDPLWMLLLGVEKARSGMMHEVAHALGTLAFPASMQKLRDEMEEIKKKSNPTDQDRQRFTVLNIEWHHRFYLTDEAENSYANRFVINRGQSGAENYGESLNYIESIFGGIAKAAKKIAGTKEKPGPHERFMNFKRAVRHSLFKNNGFFPHTQAGWRSIGVEPDWIEEVGTSPKSGWKALQSLAELTRNMEDLQPRSGEMIHGAEAFRQKNEACWRKRMDIVDEIYERFAKPIVDELKAEAEQKQKQQQEQRKEQDKQKKNKKDQKKKEKQNPQCSNPQCSNPQCSNPQPENGSEGQESETSEGKGQEQKSNGKKQKNKQEKSKRDKNQPQPESDQGNEEKQEKKKLQGGSGKKEKEEAKKPENKGEDKKSVQPEDGREDGKPEESDGNEDMELPPQSPQEMNKSADQSPNGTPLNEAPTVSELIDGKEQEQQSQKGDETVRKHFKDAQDKSGTASPSEGSAPPQQQLKPKKTGPVDLNEYEKMMQENIDVINRLERSVRQIMERQTITTRTTSPERALIPNDGNPARMDTRKLERTLSGIASGKTPRLSDFKTFKIDARKGSITPEMEIEIIIDVSGSLTGRPFEHALAAAVALNEAAKRVRGVNVSITAMGMPTPTPIARPGQSTEEISTNILQIRQTMGSGQDFLSPAVGEMLARHAAADQKRGSRKTGMTHAFVISDGFFNDGDYALVAARVMGEMAQQLTADFLILRSNERIPPIVATVTDMMQRRKQNIGLRESNVNAQIGDALLGMVEDRLNKIKPGEAVAPEVKRDSFQKALKDMQRRMLP